MPNRQEEDPSRVLVSGLNEDKILDCIEKLRALEDEVSLSIILDFFTCLNTRFFSSWKSMPVRRDMNIKDRKSITRLPSHNKLKLKEVSPFFNDKYSKMLAN
jgi:hypothetical protein